MLRMFFGPNYSTLRYIETRQSGMQSRRCEVTALFLTGSCKWARPLKNSCVFSALLRARNAACKLEEKDGNDGEDLGLDTPAEASAMSKRRRVSKAQPVDTKALWVCISVPLAKKAWKLRVLHGEGKDCLYIEFVDANFKALFAAVAASFADEAESESNCEATDSSSERPAGIVSGVKGLRWLPTRRVWDLRYFDASKKQCRCKTFGVGSDLSPAEEDSAIQEARLKAIRFRDALVA